MRTRPVLFSAAGLFLLCLAADVFFVGNSLRDEPAAGSSLPVQNSFPQIENEPDSKRRGRLLRDWTEGIATGEIGAVLVAMDREIGPDLRAEMRRELLAGWARRDLAGLAKWFQSRHAADELHQDALQAMSAALLAQGPEPGFQWMEKSLSPETRHQLYGPFFRGWADVSPAVAADRLKQLAAARPGVPVWSGLIGEVVAQWSQADLDQVVAWTRALPAGAEKTHALIQLSYEWAGRTPAAAAEYALSQNDPALIRIVAAKWAEADPQAAFLWAAGTVAGESRNGAMTGAMTTWAQKDAPAAARYIDGVGAPAVGSEPTLAVAAIWAQTDPVLAASWIGRFPEGSVRESAMAQLVELWAANDAEPAGRWLRQLPVTRSRDVALGAYAGVIGTADPVKAFQWAGLIGDETLRTQSLESAAMAWEERKKAGAL